MKQDHPSKNRTSGISRRTFVKTGSAAIAGGAVLGGTAGQVGGSAVPSSGGLSLFPSVPPQEAKIQAHRTLGRTGFQVSDVGMECQPGQPRGH